MDWFLYDWNLRHEKVNDQCFLLIETSQLIVNSFQANIPILYPLKTPENLWKVFLGLKLY